MNLRHIEIVLKVAELGSFTKAANALKIPQPSLSQSVLNLEKELKMPLFNRQTNPVSLTQAGQIYTQKAVLIASLIDELNASLSELADARRGKIRIGFSQNGYSMRPTLLANFCKKFPTADIKITQLASTLALHETLMNGKIDLALLIWPITTAGLCFEQICERKMFIALPSTHPLALKKEREISLKELENDKFILPKSSQRSRIDLDVAFKVAGFKPKIMCESETFDIGVNIVASGVGACFTIGDFITPDRQGKITLFDIKEKAKLSAENVILDKTLIIAYKAGARLGELGREFIKMAKQI